MINGRTEVKVVGKNMKWEGRHWKGWGRRKSQGECVRMGAGRRKMKKGTAGRREVVSGKKRGMNQRMLDKGEKEGKGKGVKV